MGITDCWFFFFVALLQASNLSATWTSEELRFYDRLRQLPAEQVKSETRKDSNVVSLNFTDVLLAHNISRTASYRLCHLGSMLGVTIPNNKVRQHLIDQRGPALLAVVHFNAKIDSIVPDITVNPKVRNCDIKLTLEFEDTRFSPIYAGRRLIDKILTRNHSLETPLPCALPGASTSLVSASLARISSAHSIPLISYSASSSQLDNKDIYGLFGRTIATDKGYAVAALTYYWESLGVTHCGVVYEQTEWGRAFFTEFIQAKVSFFPDMSVFSVSVNTDADMPVMQNSLKQLNDTGYSYFFGIFGPSVYDRVMAEAYKIGLAGGKKFWLFSGGSQIHLGGYSYNAVTQSDLVNATSGAGIVLMDFDPNEMFDKAWATMETDPALKEYFMSKQPEDIKSSKFHFRSSSFRHYLHYDAVMAIGIAMCEAKDKFFSGESLFDTFRNTAFRGASGLVAFDHETGTRDVQKLAYKVVNVVKNTPNEKGEVTFSHNEVARQVNDHGGLGTDTNYSLRWITRGPLFFADGGTVPPPVLPPQKWLEPNLISTAVKAVGLALAVTVMLLSLIFAFWTVHFRDDNVVRRSQPEFLLMLCTGTLLMASSIIPQSFQEPTSQKSLNFSCMAAPWLFSIGFVVSFSAFFSKATRIKKIFDESQRFRRAEVKSKDVLLPFFLLLTSNAIVLGSWTILSPLTWQRTATGAHTDEYGRQVESYGHCAAQRGDALAVAVFVCLLAIINMACFIYALFQSYRARNVPNEYNVSFYLTLSMASILQALMLGIPILVVAAKDRGVFFLTKALVINLICIAILIPLFIPKMRARRLNGERRKVRAMLRTERRISMELRTRNFSLKRDVEIASCSKGKCYSGVGDLGISARCER